MRNWILKHADILLAVGALDISQSHGGSGKQAVVNGLEADVVTMRQPLDIDLLFSSGRLIPKELAAKYFFRLESQAVPAKYAERFKPVEFFTVNEIAGGWERARQKHFADGGIFDQIYTYTSKK